MCKHAVMVHGGAIGMALILCGCAHRYLTPETETAELVGQLVPNAHREAGSDRFVFRDGPVTAAVRSPTGSWVLLDDINTADAPVLERLNPVLEQPPHWVVTENGEEEPVVIPHGFRVVATMSPPQSGSRGSGGAELSPAMSNRFTSIHMDSPGAAVADCLAEFQAMARVILPSEPLAAAAATACAKLWSYSHSEGQRGTVSLSE